MIVPDKPVIAYLVRHGRTSLNASGMFRGRANPPLDDVGLKQAKTVAQLFSTIDISAIFCSDKQRATKTAAIISQSKKTPVRVSEALQALDVGDFSGRPRTPESEAALQVYLDSPDTEIPGGESLNSFKARIAPCIQDAIDLYCECGIPPLLVCHSSVVHEAGSLAHGDHKSVLVEPGGVVALYINNGKLGAEPIFKPVRVVQNQSSTIT